MEWGAGGGVVGAVGDGGLGVGGGGIGMGVVSKEGQELGDPVDGGVQGGVVLLGGWLYGGLEGSVVGGSLLEGGSDEVGKVGGRIGVEVCRLLSGQVAADELDGEVGGKERAGDADGRGAWHFHGNCLQVLIRA